jgi:biopolymer transport protein ExbD
MKLPGRPLGPGVKFSLTPMIDVVFNLIIFFLAASHLARSNETDPVNLTTAATARADGAPLPGRLTLTITAAGEYRINGRPRSATDVAGWLVGNVGAAGGAAGLELVIRTDKSTPFERIAPVLRQCADVGLSRVRFAVEPVEVRDARPQ